MRKGRYPLGENRIESKLKEKEVIEIRKEKYSVNYYANKYNVCKSTVRDIINGKKWKYLLEVTNDR
jgi:DNA invertase Pin-like site-specific DNA recombinase